MLAALLAGFVVGTAFGAFLLYAVVPSATAAAGATPKDLYFDPSGNFPQYRDYYAARAAARFTALGGAASESALTAARDELGVTTGEVSPAAAAAMVRSALEVAAKENAAEPNPDAGRFTLQDQQNLSALADRLTATQDLIVAEAVSADPWGNLIMIGGLLGLVVLILCMTIGLWLLSRALARREAATDATSDGAAVTSTPARPARPARPANRISLGRSETHGSTASVPSHRSSVDAPVDVVVPEETDAGVAPRMRSVVPPAASTADAPLAPTSTVAAPARSGVGEQRVDSYDAVFEIGNDRFDESFPLHGPMGELIGECGASIVERVDASSPARVVAVAVWLFDKADFQSTTKVLMTDFAFADAAVREKLRNRGDAVPARLGGFDIVTASLRVEVEVVDVEYGAVGGSSNGYFERLALHFTVFRR